MMPAIILYIDGHHYVESEVGVDGDIKNYDHDVDNESNIDGSVMIMIMMLKMRVVLMVRL